MLLSIIIPFYNVNEYYVKACIKSIESNNFKNYEIIIIDDGADYFPINVIEGYKNIKYIKQLNSGVSVARNRGIEEANGDYIMFVDPDDCLIDNCLDSLLYFVKENPADIYVSFNGIIQNDTDYNYFYDKKQNIDFNNYDLILSVLNHKEILSNFSSGAPWAKIFKKDFLNKHMIRFVPGLKKSQDRIFMLYCYYYANSIELYNGMSYLYRVDNDSSICNKVNYQIDEILEFAYDEAYKFVNSFYKSDKTMLNALEKFKLSFLFIVLKLKYINRNYHNGNVFKEADEIKVYINNNDYVTILKHTFLGELPIKRRLIVLILKCRLWVLIPIIKRVSNKLR